MPAKPGAGRLLLLVCLIWPVAAAAVAQGVTFRIDPEASRVTIHVGRTGLFSFAGHTHTVAAPVSDGSIQFQPADPSRSTVELVFQASALEVQARGEPAGDPPKIQQTMESARVLDAAHFPRIAFTSRAIRIRSNRDGTIQATVTGDLTLHGVTKPETCDVRVDPGPDRLTATGVLKVKQTDFDIEPVTAGLGTVRVKDEVTIDFTLVARPSPAG